MSLRPFAYAGLGLALALSACGPKKQASSEATAGGGPQSLPPELDPAAKASVAELPAPFNAGDPVAGERIFARCRACHTIEKDGPDMTGPNLWGVFGRKAGSKPGYTYSDGMKAAGFTWDAAHLDKWLTRPAAFVSGTKMTFVGIPDDHDRRDVIAYLKVASTPLPKK